MCREMVLPVFKLAGLTVGVTVIAAILFLVCSYTCWC
jgi:hypothetical protein